MGNAQTPENYASRGEILHFLPKASTDISSGDVVVLARKNDPISLSQVGPAGRIRPIGAAREAQWAVGVVDEKVTSDIVGATEYATPTKKLRVQRKGLFYLAISDTSGKAGDCVKYSSGATGAQVFAIDNMRQGFAVARIAVDFSGATANDRQLCELIEKPVGAPDINFFLENRVIQGCSVRAATQPASQVMIGKAVGTVAEQNIVIIQGRVFSIARDTALALGGVASLAASTVRFKWVVARSASFAIRSGSGTKAGLASYTAAGVTAGLLSPVTMTGGEIPVALLIQFSAATQSAPRIRNVRGPAVVPRVGSWGI